ncbi:MAG: MarR family winged helix-turn-helix transcriptional regulator [Syntrophobacter sp.]
MVGGVNDIDEERAAHEAFVTLTHAAESLNACVHRHLAGMGITVSQMGVLEALYSLGPLSQGRIGKLLLRSGGNMTLVIDNLEKRKLVRRKRKESDRRYYIVDLTVQGRKLIGELFPVHLKRITEHMGVLTRDEQAELERLCRKLGNGGLKGCQPISG